MTRLLLVGWLAFVWVLLWGTPSPANVLGGVLLGTLLVVVVPHGRNRGGGVHPLAVIRYGAAFVVALVVATASVARAVLQPRMKLEEGIVAVPLRAVSPVVVAFVANSVTLTPGTMTIDIRPRDYAVEDRDEPGSVPDRPEPVAPVLYVHCLVTGDPDEVRADVRRFEELAVAAFGTVADRTAIRRPPPPWPRPRSEEAP